MKTVLSIDRFFNVKPQRTKYLEDFLKTIIIVSDWRSDCKVEKN